MLPRLAALQRPFLRPAGKARHHCVRATAVAASSSTPAVESVADCTPQLPLSCRGATDVEPLHKLLAWRTDTLARIHSIGAAFEEADGGPGEEELQREVGWVLDDAVAMWRPGEADAWRGGGWAALQAELPQAAAHVSSGGVLGGDQVLLRAPVQQLAEWWRQRLEERVPYQYLISTSHWRDYILSVGPGVLIPRPETEIMPDLAAAALDARPHLAAAPWADLGTGSGAVAVALAAVLRQRAPDSARVWACDLSPAALRYAALNAERLGLAGVVCTAEGSWCDALPAALRGQLGGLLSNPPYIPEEQMVGLQAEVGRHEPRNALTGGDGPGLDSLKVICAQAVDMLMPGGFLALETAGGEQAQKVAALLRAPHVGTAQQLVLAAAFENVLVVEDCYGKSRFVTAFRVGGSRTC